MDPSVATALKEAFISDILRRLFEESLPRIKTCLEKLTTEQIWWRPNENSNSIGNLVLHLNGNVRQWILSGIAGEPDLRERQLEFSGRPHMNAHALASLLDTLEQDTHPVIRQIPLQELLRERPVQVYHETGIAILIHVTEHFSYHTGQIAYITKMLLDSQVHFYDDSILG